MYLPYIILKEFNIANKQTPTSESIATNIGILINIASIITINLIPIEPIIFILTIFIVFFEILITLSIEVILSSIYTISLALIAISLPIDFIAIPTSLSSKQAASLIPSPT